MTDERVRDNENIFLLVEVNVYRSCVVAAGAERVLKSSNMYIFERNIVNFI